MRCLACGSRSHVAPRPCAAHDARREAAGPTLAKAPAIAGYRLVHRLGTGAFGAVFQAHSSETELRVAVKVAHAGSRESARQLANEAKVLGRLRGIHSPRVVEDATSARPVPYLAMELLEGTTLAHALASWTSTTLAERVAWATSLLDAVGAIHAAGVVHGDLKPENIILPERGSEREAARLVDFGLARLVRAGEDEDGDSAPSEIHAADFGTPEYMPPEALAGFAAADGRGDVYALGVVLFELFTGSVPFFGDRVAVREGHSSRRPLRPDRLADLPAAWSDAILRCLTKAREERPAKVAELRVPTASFAARTDSTAPRREASITPPSGVDIATPRGARRKQLAAILHVPADVDTLRLVAAAETSGGDVASRRGDVISILWIRAERSHPVDAAIACARALTAQRICDTAVVDYAPVSVLERPGGGRIVAGSAIAAGGKHLAVQREPGIYVTSGAADVSSMAHAGSAPTAPAPTELRSLDELEAAWTRATDAPLVGRDALLASLLRQANACFESSIPGLTTIIGAEGLGKSALLRAVARALERDDRRPDVLRLGERTRGEDALRAVVRWRPTSHEGSEPETDALLAFACGDMAADDPRIAAMRLPPSALRAAVARAVASQLTSSAHGPVVVLLDDAELAPPVLLDALEAATSGEARGRLWICVASSPRFEDGRKTWSERAARAERHSLAPLTTAEMSALCRELLRPAEDVPAKAVEALRRRAAGSPAVLAGLVAGLKHTGAVRRRQRGEAFYIATDEIDRLPERSPLQWFAEKLAAELPDELAATGGLAAVLGPHVVVDDARTVLDELDARGLGEALPLDAAVALDRLAAHGILEHASDGGFSFRNDFVRLALRGRLGPDRCAALDDAAYVALSPKLAEGDVSARARLASHAALAGRRAEALALYAEVAEACAAGHDEARLERACSRFLELATDDDARVAARLLRLRGIARYRLARYEDADTDFTDARARARSAGDVDEEARVLLDHATALDWMNEYTRSTALVDEARVLVDGAGLAHLRPEMTMADGRAASRAGDPVAAYRLLTEAAVAAREEPELHYESLVASLVLLGGIGPAVGHFEDAERANAEAIALADAHGDASHRALALFNRTFLLIGKHDYDGVCASLHASLAAALEAGMPHVAFWASEGLALFTLQNGDLTAGRGHVASARRRASRHGGVNDRIAAELLELRLRFLERDDPRARAALERIRTLREEETARGAPEPLVPEQRQVLEMFVLAIMGGSEQAWDALEDAAEGTDLSGDAIEIACVRAECARRRGDLDAERAHLGRALARAEGIPNVMRDRLRALVAAPGARA